MGCHVAPRGSGGFLSRFALSLGVAAGLICAAATAWAADPVPWTGFYVGGSAGILTGTTGFSDPNGPGIYGGDVPASGFMAGIQLGHNWLVERQWLLGLEAAGSLATSPGTNTCMQSSPAIIASNCKVSPRGQVALTGRLGALTEPGGRTLLYGKGGVAWMRADLSIEPNDNFAAFAPAGAPVRRSIDAWGWTVGAGIERSLSPSSSWSMFAEYDYMRVASVAVATPATVIGTSSSTIAPVPGGTSSVSFDQHTVKLGLNYRFGGPAAAARAPDPDAGSESGSAPPWSPGWEFTLGTRYWYAWGRYGNSNGRTDEIVSRLTYTDMRAHSGELVARLDSPYGVFAKALGGGGFITSGIMFDEDWGDATESNNPLQAYSRTDSGVSGSMNYFTFDVGYNVMRGTDHKVGLFVGYNRLQVVMSAFGCNQLVNPSPGVCDPAPASGRNGISELDTWQSLRTGVSAEVKLSPRFSLAGEVAYLPYASYAGLDIHHLREPVVNFPWQGKGQGVQAELIATWQATDAFSLGLGGRYWSLWTNTAFQSNVPTNVFFADTQWYGLLVQASYRFLPK